MAGHSVDDYLETIYFLAFPIGEYTPPSGNLPLASRVAEMLGVSRASAGEMLKRLEAEGLIERGSRKEALLTASGRVRAEHVGFGSDFLREYVDELYPQYDRVPFEGLDMKATIPGLVTTGDLPRLTERLLERGFAEDDVRGFLGGNLARVFREVFPA